jgi:hypothetical protein
MADEQAFDRRAAGTRLRDLAGEVESIRTRLIDVVKFYSTQSPGNESDEGKYKRGMKDKLRTQRDAINSLMDRL